MSVASAHTNQIELENVIPQHPKILKSGGGGG